MNWKGKKVAVTGANGFIGSHLVEKLAKLGAKVSALTEYNPYNDIGLLKFVNKNTLKNIVHVPFDLRDSEILRKLLKDIDVVFHLGAVVSIPYSYLHPQEVFEVNAIGTMNILLACRDMKVKKIVTTSTSEVYGTALYVPIDEKHPLQAQSPYSASKIAADKIAESFHKAYGLPVAVIRPFNTFGPRQSDRAIIPTIIIQALKKKVIEIGSLSPRRDLNYVEDTVEGFIKIAESPNTIGEVINIGSGKDISIGELVKLILALIKKDIKIVSSDKRKRPDKSEVMRLLCDNTKARKLIDWKPRVTLRDGLTKTIEWIKEHPEYYNPDKYQI